MGGIRQLWEYRRFLAEFTYQQLRQRYHSSVLGFLWTLLNPLLIYVCFCIIFSYINHWDLKGYGIYFFSGYMAWTFFSTAVMMGTDSVVNNASYVTRISVPKAIFPLSVVAIASVDLLASFVVLGGLMWFLGATFTPALWILPLSTLLLGIFVVGFCLLAAVFTVFLRDFKHLLSSIFFIWFFFCPILYRDTVIPANARAYFDCNPILPFLHLFQAPIAAGQWPASSDLVTSAFLAALTLAAGAILFFRSEKRFYYYV